MLKERNKFWFLILTLIFIVPSFLALVILPFFTFHDEVQIVNLYEYFRVFDLGQFPPVWAPDMHFHFGSPFLAFNYQLPYYLGYLFHLTGLSLTLTFKALLILGLISGAVGMYVLSLSFTAPIWAFVTAIIYTFAPYRAVTTYVRGTLGEALALGIFPWVFWSLYRLKTKTKKEDLFLAGIMVAALILTHQLAAILSLPFIILLTFGYRQIKSVVLGVVLSAYYWVPVILEKKLIQESSPFNFYDHFPFIKQLIYSRFAWGASVEGIGDWMSFQVGFVNWLILIVSILYIVFKIIKNCPSLRGQHPDYSRTVLVAKLVASTLGVLFLMNIRSSFFWRVFPFTQMVQFPWRLLMLTTLFTSLLAAVISGLFKSKWTGLLVIPVLLLTLIPTVSYFQPGEVFDRNDQYYLNRFLPGTDEYLKHTEDYVPLPVGAIRPKSLPKNKIEAIRKLDIKVIDENPFNYQAEISQPQAQEIIFNTFNYAGWKALVDDKEVEIKSNDKGYIAFDVPRETHKIQIKLTDTRVRFWSKIISLITLLTMLELFLYEKIRR